MSLQDDIFDIEEALKESPELSAFESIINYLYEMENHYETIRKENDILRKAIDIIGDPKKQVNLLYKTNSIKEDTRNVRKRR